MSNKKNTDVEGLLGKTPSLSCARARKAPKERSILYSPTQVGHRSAIRAVTLCNIVKLKNNDATLKTYVAGVVVHEGDSLAAVI